MTAENHNLTSKLWRFLRNEDGPTSVEYCVMLALIIVVLIASITLVGGETFNYWQSSNEQLEAAYGS